MNEILLELKNIRQFVILMWLLQIISLICLSIIAGNSFAHEVPDPCDAPDVLCFDSPPSTITLEMPVYSYSPYIDFEAIRITDSDKPLPPCESDRMRLQLRWVTESAPTANTIYQPWANRLPEPTPEKVSVDAGLVRGKDITLGGDDLWTWEPLYTMLQSRCRAPDGRTSDWTDIPHVFEEPKQ